MFTSEVIPAAQRITSRHPAFRPVVRSPLHAFLKPLLSILILPRRSWKLYWPSYLTIYKIKMSSSHEIPQLNGLHLALQPFGQWFDYHPVQLETIFIIYCIFPTIFNYNNCRSMHRFLHHLHPIFQTHQ